jgi:hypothetical protein
MSFLYLFVCLLVILFPLFYLFLCLYEYILFPLFVCFLSCLLYHLFPLLHISYRIVSFKFRYCLSLHREQFVLPRDAPETCLLCGLSFSLRFAPVRQATKRTLCWVIVIWYNTPSVNIYMCSVWYIWKERMKIPSWKFIYIRSMTWPTRICT